MASPITPVLKSSARSAYRALFRASGTTFAGDDRVLYAFRDKVRTETVAGRQEVDPVEYEARVKHAFEVADVLKKNVVQAEKQGEGEHTAWKLRMTSDTELGSNEGVKAPYSRPTRGEPRLKCGEVPNAVAPLPPRSLQHMVSNSTRSHSPAASSSSSPPDPNPTPAEQEYEYDRLRVQAVRNRLNQVNIRVSASPTGREFMTERILVEDKLSALVARMEFLASDMHDKLYPPSSNSAPAQTLVELLLDHLPISPQSNVDPVGPPVQLRQYIRFLQSAAKHTIALRNETLSLMPEIRIAIAELVETPSPGTRSPNNAIDSLRAIQWRLLMIKRGIQGIAKSRRVFYSKTATMLDALRLAMANVSYAHDCVEDLEMNGPRVEDARSLVEEIEKSAKGSYLPDLRKEMERRLQAGVAWKRVEETMISHGLSPTLIYLTRKVYHRIRQYEENYPRVLDFVAKAQRKGDIEGAKRWRRKPFTRSQRLLNTMQGHMETFNIALNRLIARHPQNDEKAGFLHKAKQALDLSMDVTSEHIVAIRNQAEHATWLEWASTVATRLDLVGELVERTVAADRYLEQYIRGEPGGWELDVGEKDLFFDARTQLIIIYDVAWRLEKRMKQDVEDLREVSVLLCEEGQSDFEDLRTFTGWHKRVKAKFSSWEGREYNAQRSPSDGNRAVRSRPEDASPINASKSFFALDE